MRKVWSIVSAYLKGNRIAALCAVLCVVATVYVRTVCIVGSMQSILDNGVYNKDFDYVIQTGISMLGYTLLLGVLIGGSAYLSTRAAAGLALRVRSALVRKAVALSSGQAAAVGKSSIVNRVTNDTLSIQSVVITVVSQSLVVPLLAIAVLAQVASMNLLFFFVLLAAIVLVTVVLVVLGIWSRRELSNLSNASDAFLARVIAKGKGAETIRLFNAQSIERERIGVLNGNIMESVLKFIRTSSVMGPASCLIMYWAVVVIYYLGSQQVQAGVVSVSDTLVLFQYVIYIVEGMSIIPVLVSLVPSAIESASRINGLLEMDEEAHHEGRREGIERGGIVFDHVSFSYGGQYDALHDASFEIKPGSVTAFFGGAGSGKSTAINLIMGVGAVKSGRVLIDGHDGYEESYLMGKISWAPQQITLFADSVRENVRVYNKDISDEAVLHACRISRFDEVLAKLDDGLYSKVERNGANFSGGQRQRLSIARAVAKPGAAIYLLDDTLSGLDPKTERTVRENLLRELEDKTVVIVSQRISTVAAADRIVVFDDGRIVDQGPHAQLYDRCASYRRACQIQLGIEVDE